MMGVVVVVKQSFVVLGAVALLTVAGCQRAVDVTTSKAVEQATGAQVSKSGDTVTIKTKEGDAVTVGGGMSAELKDFPIPSGFQAEKDGFGSMSSGGDSTSVGSWSGAMSAQ